MQISQLRVTKRKIYTIMKKNDSYFRLSRSNLFELGDLTKISLYYFGTFANFTRPIVNFNKPWFFAQNLSKINYKAYPTKWYYLLNSVFLKQKCVC